MVVLASVALRRRLLVSRDAQPGPCLQLPVIRRAPAVHDASHCTSSALRQYMPNTKRCQCPLQTCHWSRPPPILEEMYVGCGTPKLQEVVHRKHKGGDTWG